MEIHKSAEDYLEAMLMMKERHGYVRSIDVAEQLGVTKPSVSYATKQLRENGYTGFKNITTYRTKETALLQLFSRVVLHTSAEPTK